MKPKLMMIIKGKSDYEHDNDDAHDNDDEHDNDVVYNNDEEDDVML
jgi:hypothetical protein